MPVGAVGSSGDLGQRIQGIVQRTQDRVQLAVQRSKGNDGPGDPGVNQEQIQSLQQRKADRIQGLVDIYT